MNNFSHLPEEEFVSICKGAFNNHALRVCDTSRILSSCEPRYTKDFDYGDFDFVRRQGIYSAIWMTSYDATAAHEHVTLRHLIQVWICDYHQACEVDSLTNSHALAESIVRDIVLVLSASGSNHRYINKYSCADIQFTIITNVDIDPEVGDPSLIAIVREKLVDFLGRVRHLQIGSSFTMQEDLDASRHAYGE